ncbi:MAG: UTP--glucose-1-phosphate uridylyltransferase [Candidatus Algichlamydia australiensis]|nr:UTP--glucose-1-phosphate uridylyltransferase [Chlamydiales bacterium]
MTSPHTSPDLPFDDDLYRLQKELIVAPKESLDAAFFPPKNFTKKISKETKQRGERAIDEGRVACVVLAGGQGTRLGFPGPKGTAKVLGEKSLFELLCEKIPSHAQVAIMTSPQNDRETREFFFDNQLFGLSEKNLHFFQQNQLPLMDESGSWFADKDGKTVMAPNGNGEALQLLYQNGIYAKWREMGVAHVNSIHVDNPLANPFDPELVGLQIEKEVPLAIKAVEKCNCHESMGLFTEKGGRISVLEYSEFSEKKLHTWTIANAGLFCVTMDFIEKIHAIDLPLHVARKTVKGKKVFKFEKFNFDLFLHANSYAGILADRKTCFSPLKNAIGSDSFETVKKDLLSR